ncbi:MAG: hypothetical protein K6A29_01995, partial [Lachnospiraceae bacterium]|nr:hypothetical protein [Lachnospiraceae bacterium]
SREILTDILPYLNIPMTEDVSDKEREELLQRELSIYTNRVAMEDASGNEVNEEAKENAQ